jgi:general stress protein 26
MHPMTTTALNKLHDLLEDFDTAMLVTTTPDGRLRSRPMALADMEPDGTLWFLTERGSPKVVEITREEQVNVAMQSSQKFVSISGIATPVINRKKIEELWKESWTTWFPGGKNDPTLVLLRVDPESGEYWDNSGASGVKYLIEAGKAYLTGTKPDVEGDPQIHGKVNL